MKILMVGAGAVGGLFGTFLHEHGADLRFLVRPERQRRLEVAGLTLELPDGRRHIAPQTVTADRLDEAADLVVLTNKAYALPGVIDDIRGAVGPNTYLLPLLNGLRHLDDLDRAFGEARVLGGIAKTIATQADPTTIRVSNPHSSLIVGARRPEQAETARAVSGLMHAAGIKVALSDDILGDMWDKFSRMAALGASNCLLQGTVGEYMQSDAGGEIALRLFHECTETARAHGHPLEAAAIDGFRRALTNPGSGFNSSMYRDMRHGLPIEGEHLVGDMRRRAQAAGIASPMLEVAQAVLQTYSAKRSR